MNFLQQKLADIIRQNDTETAAKIIDATMMILAGPRRATLMDTWAARGFVNPEEFILRQIEEVCKKNA